MSYLLGFSSEAEKVMEKWKKSNPALFKKLGKILHELVDHPKEGIGKPEPLVGGNDVTYSRRITGQHRIIYDIYEEEVCVYVITVEGHYDDK